MEEGPEGEESITEMLRDHSEEREQRSYPGWRWDSECFCSSEGEHGQESGKLARSWSRARRSPQARLQVWASFRVQHAVKDRGREPLRIHCQVSLSGHTFPPFSTESRQAKVQGGTPSLPFIALASVLPSCPRTSSPAPRQ